MQRVVHRVVIVTTVLQGLTDNHCPISQ